MALDLTAFFAEAQSENAKIGAIIRGLEDLSDDHMTVDEHRQIQAALEIYKHFFRDIDEITQRIAHLEELKYPILPTFPITAAFKQKIEQEVSASQAAAALFVLAPDAVDGPLVVSDPLEKPTGVVA